MTARLSRLRYARAVVEQRDPERPEGREPSRLEARQLLIERKIQEAIDAGRFRDLPHQGRRLPLEDDSAAGEWAMAFRLMRDAGVAPDWVEADKEARALASRIETLIERAGRVGRLARPRLRRDLEELAQELESAVFRLNAQAPTDRQHRPMPDRAALRDRLEAAFRG